MAARRPGRFGGTSGKMWRGVALLSVLLAGFVAGFLFRQARPFPYDALRWLGRSLVPETTAEPEPTLPGRWHPAGKAPAKDDVSERLLALGYLQAYEAAPAASGTTILQADGVQPGLTLFCSGHAPVVLLVALDGTVVHRWQLTFEDVWPGELPFDAPAQHGQFIRRAHVFPNGDLLAIFEYIGLVKLDRDSNVLWKDLGREHHDLVVDADGSIVTLARRHRTRDEVLERYPGFGVPAEGIFDDEILVLEPDGTERRRVSLLDAFYRSDYAPFLGIEAGRSDLFHTNSVDLVEPRHERSGLVAGDVLVSLRNKDAVGTVDLDEERVSWLITGEFKEQHQAQLLDDGRLLVFDNRGGSRHAPLRFDRSEVLEIDPPSQRVVWRYAGSDEAPLFSRWLGSVRPLANGNVLITESTRGRILEVSRDGRIQWEYLSPHRAGEGGSLIASVMGARRIAEEDLPFLAGKGPRVK